MTKKDFALRLKYLKRLGAMPSFEQEYRQSEGGARELHNLELFRSIWLPFSAEEWCSLCMSDGNDYVGGCCGSMSHIQDIMDSIFRFDSGYVACDRLAEIAQAMIQHGELKASVAWKEERSIIFGRLPEPLHKFMPKVRVKSLGPWDKMALVWHIVKNHYGPQKPNVFGANVNELERAVSVLSGGLWTINMSDLFTRKEAPESQTKASRAMLMARLLPALKTLNENIDKLDVGEVEGYALMAKNEEQKIEEQIAYNSLGLCVYSTKKEADDLLKLWEKQAKEYKDLDNIPGKRLKDQYSIKKVRVSSKRGIEFI